MLARSLHDFHQWLFFSAPGVARSIVIEPVHRDPEVLAWAVGRELNERNPDYEGRWITFLPEVLTQIAADPCERRLLGLADRFPDRCALSSVCLAILKKGYVVLQGVLPAIASAGIEDVFHVSMADSRSADLHLSPSALPNNLLPVRIADAFIDWNYAKNLAPVPSADVTSRFGIRSIPQSYHQPGSCSRIGAE